MEKCIRFVSIFLCFVLICPCAAGENERLRTAQEVMEFVKNQTGQFKTEFCISYLSGLDDEMGDGKNVNTLLRASGLLDWTRRSDWEHRRIYIEDCVYMKGYKILLMYRQGREAELNSTEKRILQEALDIAEAAVRNGRSGGEAEAYIHDELCRRVTYTSGEDMYPDSEYGYCDDAEGALLYGQAECDGYSDAFYLISNLAGIHTMCISGYSGNETEAKNEYDSHMWNLVEINGQWFHTDVTWDDLDYEKTPGMHTYRYMNIGSNDIEMNHIWKEELLPCSPLAAYTNWDHFYFTGWHAGNNFESAYYHAAKDGAKYVRQQEKAGKKYVYVMLDGENLSYTVLLNAMKKAGVRSGSYIWDHPMGEYTCFSVYLYK